MVKTKTSKGYRLSADIVELIDKLATQTRSSKTRIIEIAVLEYSKKHQEEKSPTN